MDALNGTQRLFPDSKKIAGPACTFDIVQFSVEGQARPDKLGEEEMFREDRRARAAVRGSTTLSSIAPRRLESGAAHPKTPAGQWFAMDEESANVFE